MEANGAAKLTDFATMTDGDEAKKKSPTLTH